MDIGIKDDKRLVFHSFRNNYVGAMRRASYKNPEVMDPLDGRNAINKERGSRKDYDEDLSPAELYPIIENMDLKVDLSHLYKQDGR